MSKDGLFTYMYIHVYMTVIAHSDCEWITVHNTPTVNFQSLPELVGEAVCVVCLLCVKLESKRRLVF